MAKERQYVTRSNCVKGVSSNVILDEKWIRDLWKEYTEKLMNEETIWCHGILSEVKAGPADCIRIGEAVAALKKDEKT